MKKAVIIMIKKGILGIFICFLAGCFVFFTGYEKAVNPEELYRVYLDGQTIGYIKNKSLLEDYIDKEQGDLKTKYKVDKVYAPNGLDIVKEVTFGQKVSTEKEIYDKIKDLAPFTINGYIITIKGTTAFSESEGEFTTDDLTLYVLDKELFNDAVKNTVSVFIPQDTYNNFINDTQPEIVDTGTLIEDIYIKNDITIKEGRISTEEKIFTDIGDLDKYLLFGTTEEQQTYVVKSGDVISDIAYNNKLSVQEFLIANPDFTSENNLLYEGQVVNLGLIDPLFNLVEEDHMVELQTQNYDTVIEYDENLLLGYETVKQNGVNGTLRVTKKVQKVNGDIMSAVIASSEVVKPSIPRIIVRGNKVIPSVGNLSYWQWPTLSPYVISSPYGWRGGDFHDGLDISGTGYGSPIYAANNGTVVEAGYTSVNGNYVYINHNNGYYSIYGHMSSLNVKKGQVVSMGDRIGSMGNSGWAFGTHLHFGIFYGYPFRSGSYTVNPLEFY